MKKTVDLSIKLAGVDLGNPLILASGIMGVSAASLKFVEESGAGAVTCKSIGPTVRPGHHNPTVIPWEKGIINAVGLSNPGIDAAVPFLKQAKKELNVPLIISIFADKPDNFVRVAEKLNTIKPVFVEINLSCPNTEDDFGRMFALDPKLTEKAVSAVVNTLPKAKIFAKLSPDAPNIGEIGRAAEAAGASGITATNTVSGMIIDFEMRRPVLTNKFGGVSGPAIKPISLRAVFNLYKAVKIPIIGTGGVTTGRDALEFTLAGATAVGVGSAVYYEGIGVFKKITDEMMALMKKEGIKSLEEIRGAAHYDKR